MSNTDPSRNRLGRGLSALLGNSDDTATAPRTDNRFAPRALPVGQLSPSPLQPRRRFAEEALSELTASVKEKGVLQPILVRPSAKGDGTYEIVAGERRWRAAQRAGVHDVPVVVRDLTDSQVLEVALIENVQRTDLNAVEEGRGYKALIDQHGYTQEQLSRVIGKSRSHIANTMRLLSLPESVLAKIESGALSAGHARTLIGRQDAEFLAARMVEEGLTVRAAETLTRTSGSAAPSTEHRIKPAVAKDADTLGLEKSVSDALGLKVTITDKNGKGEVRIAYSSLEQLEDVCARLKTRLGS